MKFLIINPIYITLKLITENQLVQLIDVHIWLHKIPIQLPFLHVKIYLQNLYVMLIQTVNIEHAQIQ